MVSLTLQWIDGMTFTNGPGSPAVELASGRPGVSSPVETLAYAVAGCMAMDLVHVLHKRRKTFQALTVRVEGERATTEPRRFTSLALHFDLTGDVEPDVVERAIALSKTTYCSVWHTIRPDVPLNTTYVIHPAVLS